MKSTFHQIWHHAWATVLVEMSDQEIAWLMRARHHISLLEKRRTTMIVSRVRLVAGLFALLTPLWIIVDVVAFPREVWLPLVLARVAATLAFWLVLFAAQKMNGIRDAYWSLALLMAIPTSFFLFSYQHMAQFQMHGLQAAFSTGYAFLPFVMLAGLSIFPLTLLEAIAFISPLLLMQVAAGAMRLPVLDWPTFAASFWLMLLIAGVAALAGLSQLAFIIVLVREAIRDGMTGCFSRQSGEELLELQFILSNRSGNPLTAAFIDLDYFKQVNDKFGHDAGDKVLINAAEALKQQLRLGDMLTRWGGEEFVLIMPNTTAPLACKALARVRASGFGARPDGTPMTASIGVAERVRDGVEDWRQLVELADQRMYGAKQSGRDRMVGCDMQEPGHPPQALRCGAVAELD
ncbi:MAG: diguanylate cyclase [Rhodocyclales bacterium GWA2_65_20]|nr:MAG: diguanylate cyclase [Rhodocyclales bacterium GWA2_65_20]